MANGNFKVFVHGAAPACAQNFGDRRQNLATPSWLQIFSETSWPHLRFEFIQRKFLGGDDGFPRAINGNYFRRIWPLQWHLLFADCPHGGGYQRDPNGAPFCCCVLKNASSWRHRFLKIGLC